MQKKNIISVISPVYKAEGIVFNLVSEIKKSVGQITEEYEIILVEDGSPDRSWDEIVEETKKDHRVKAIKLSKNYGQHYAITAGLNHANGNWVVVMDCDLQDRPEEIIRLYKKAIEGYDIVLAKRLERTDGFYKKLSSRSFYYVLSYLTGSKQDPTVANFGIYSAKVIDAINLLKEPIRYFPTMVSWVGFKKTYQIVEHGERFSGKTSYNWQSLFRLALDIILANSDKPIRLVVKFGLLISLTSFFIGIAVLYKYFTNQIKVAGYTSLLVSVWFIGGIILFVLGLIGLYIGKIFEGVKGRPIYIKDSEINFND